MGFKFKIRKQLTLHEMLRGKVMVYMALFICIASFCANLYVEANTEETDGTFTYND